VRPLVFTLCLLVYHPKMCDHSVNMLVPVFYHNFFHKVINGNKFCIQIGVCDSKLVIDSTDKYIDRVLSDKPIYSPSHIHYDVAPLKFLFFTDVHTDKKY